jgi:hypothetical protein
MIIRSNSPVSWRGWGRLLSEALGRQQSRLDDAVEPALVGMVREVIKHHAKVLHER